MMRLRRLVPWATKGALGFLVVFHAAIFVVVAGSSGNDGEPRSEPPALLAYRELTIVAPAEVAAGEPFEVTVTGGPAEDLATLVIDGGYGPREVTSVIDNGVAVFEVLPNQGPEAGTALLEVTIGTARINSTVEVLPGEPVDPLDLYLGPRTIIADANDFSMIVAVPEDQFGNPVSEGTSVDFRITRPSLSVERQATSTRGLLSFIEIWSETLAGRTRIGVSAGDAEGPERSFMEVAGVPAPYELSLPEPIPPADGATLVSIRTDLLVDEFGNVMPDGTIAYLDASGSTGNRRLTGFSIDGFVIFVVEVPDAPGSAEFSAVASGTRSAPLTVDFPAAVLELPVEIADHDDGIEITVGRVVSTRGSYAPDGTMAVIEVDGKTIEVALEQGLGSVVVGATLADISVSVLGVDATSIEDRRR